MKNDISLHNLDELMVSAQEACGLARKVLLDYFGDLTRVSEKAKAGLVTEADIQSEQIITDLLREKHPDIKIIGEEESYKNQNQSFETKGENGACWIIDPLDGTTNFVHEFPIYCISIGLFINGETHLGIIDVPSLDRTYSAISKKGAFKDGKKIQVSQRKKLSDSLLATGFYHHEEAVLDEQLKIFSKFLGKARGVRRAGAAAFDLCMIAEGVFDAFWEKNLSPWDTCAGELIVREAGGKVSDYEGNKYTPFLNSIIATNQFLYDPILENIKSSLN